MVCGRLAAILIGGAAAAATACCCCCCCCLCLVVVVLLLQPLPGATPLPFLPLKLPAFPPPCLAPLTPRRGYREAMHRAPLNEAAAAGILTLAGWPALCKQGVWGGRLVCVCVCVCVRARVCVCVCTPLTLARRQQAGWIMGRTNPAGRGEGLGSGEAGRGGRVGARGGQTAHCGR